MENKKLIIILAVLVAVIAVFSLAGYLVRTDNSKSGNISARLIISTGSGSNQTANYTGFTGDQVYYRAIYAASAHSSGILELIGLVNTDILQVGSGNVNVEIKLPTQTGWMDLGKAYDSGTFNWSDGDGCQVSQSGSTWGWTSTTKSTYDSGYMIIVRITLRTAIKPIMSIRETTW